MSQEFKYIPYSPYDHNIRGLVSQGNVCNLKYPSIQSADGKTYSMGLEGLFLPENDREIDAVFQDLEYMKSMYPDDIRKVSAVVEEECDKLEYEGSPMLAAYPDREEMRRVARNVYDELDRQGYILDKTMDIAVTKHSTESEDNEPPYLPDGPGHVNGASRNIIELLVCNEFCMRRDRHRRRRRRFY